MDDPSSKRCPTCGVLKPRSAFSLSRTRYDGLQGECKPCRSSRYATYRAAFPDRERARHARYHAEHREALLPKQRAWRKTAYYRDPEKARKQRRDYWRSLTPEERTATLRRHRESRYRAWAKWRAQQVATEIGPISRRGIIARDASTCYLCGLVLTPRQIELDHVVPLSRGGTHTEDNIRVACRPCNRWKSDRLLSEL